jgi:hypothetical protein
MQFGFKSMTRSKLFRGETNMKRISSSLGVLLMLTLGLVWKFTYVGQSPDAQSAMPENNFETERHTDCIGG